MPAKTSGNLELNKPANGEYQDNWDVPLNENADTIDEHVSSIEDEVIDARGGTSSLAERMDACSEPDGSPKPVPEVVKSRYSQMSGRYTDLYERLNIQDQEKLYIRHGKTSFIDGLAYLLKDSKYNSPISGPKGGNDAANFLVTAGSVFTIDGNPTPVVMNCNGYIQVCRIDKSIDLVGQSSGTKYVYAERTTGRVVENGTTNGETGGSALNEFYCAAAQFVTKSVQQGDLLILSSGPNADTYIVDTIVDEQHLTIKGKFVDARSAQSFEVKDMLHPNISYETVKTSDRCYLGEVVFNGTTITSVVTYAYRCEFEAAWVAIDVSSSPVFTQTFNHNLGRIPKDILIYASQTNTDDTVEVLSIADVTSDYDIHFNAGTSDATVAPTGGPYMTRSVKAQLTRNTITLQNVRNNVFYKDFSGTVRSAGYLKVIIRG